MRGQVAMEFIATYGWAVMVVLLGIGALVYFGVLDIGSSTPERCFFSPGFRCYDFQLRESTSGDNLLLSLQNKQGKAIVLSKVRAFCVGCNQEFTPEKCFFDGSTDWTNTYTVGTDEVVKLDCQDMAVGLSAGSQEKVDLTFMYRFFDSDIEHSERGEIVANVEE